LFDDLKGKQFWNNGNRYEGEWKDGNMNGQGKKTSYYFVKLILAFF